MEAVEGILYGLATVLTVQYIIASLAGALLGTIMGLLPGIGPAAGAAILLPLTYVFDPLTGMIIIAGMFYGFMYGGSTTSILLNIPGDAPSVVSAFEGYPLAKQGRAGPALGVTAVASFVAGTGGLIVVAFVAAPVANLAIIFGSAEYFALTFGGLVILSRLMGGKLGASFIPLGIGLLLGIVGADITSGLPRFWAGVSEVRQGINVVPLAVGLFGISEIMRLIIERQSLPKVKSLGWRAVIPTREDIRNSRSSWFRGGVIGFVLGLLPGPSVSLATFTSYKIESRFGRDREKYGKGSISGLAGPEAANNGAATSSLIPLLSLGLPFSATLAVLLVAMQVHGIQPGPRLVDDHPDLFWGLIASLLIGNFVLLILNVNLIRVWISFLKIPGWILMPIILAVCYAGVFSFRRSWFDLIVVSLLGIIGFFLMRYRYQTVPILLGCLLGPQVERHLRQGLTSSGGDITYFFTQPIAATIWVIVIAIVIVLPVSKKLLKRKAEVPSSVG